MLFLLTLPFPAIDPVLVSFGPVAVRWYGLAYLFGILLGWFYITRLVRTDSLWKKDQMRPNSEQIGDFVIWAVLGIVGGGRLGYALLYEPAYFIAIPSALFKLWEGGMSFHGGFLGMILAMLGFAYWHRVPVWTLFDLVAAAAPIGLFFGRIANFINGELWGWPTDLPWGIVFPNAGPLPRHPSQLYEAALEGILLFFLLRFLTHSLYKLQTPGFVAGALTAGYSCARIISELFRVPDTPDSVVLIFGYELSRGTLYSLPMLVVGGVVMGWSFWRNPYKTPSQFPSGREGEGR